MNLLTLPSEVLEKILQSLSLCHKDLLSLTSTCKRLHELINSNNELWKRKFATAFFILSKQILENMEFQEISWQDEFKKRLKMGHLIDSHLEDMGETFHRKGELSNTDFRWFDDLLLRSNPSRCCGHLHMLDKLHCLVTSPETDSRLTDKFYAEKALAHVQHRLLSGHPFLAEEAESLDHEEVMLLVAQWAQPTKLIRKMDIATQLDKFAQNALSCLFSKNPEHPIFEKIREEQKNSAKIIFINLPSLQVERDNLWGSKECREILDSVRQVLFIEGGLKGNKRDYYNPANSFVNQVLESGHGIPITLCIIHHCVLRRLGVVTEPINFPGHFLLKWLDPCPSGGAVLLDSFDGGRQLKLEEARERLVGEGGTLESYRTASPRDTACRMLRNLISIGASRSSNLRDDNYSLLRLSLELMIKINPGDTMQYAFMLSRVYIQLNINHEEVMHMLQELRDDPGISDQVDYLMAQCQLQIDNRSNPEEAPPPEKRGVRAFFPFGEASFWVGQVCRHLKYNYICVIYGWDPICKASKSWIRQMGVDRLDSKDRQPFYNVLVADGSNRYAAQENLVPIKPVTVTHSQVGKYFTEFKQDFGYVSNSQLSRDYPDEGQISKPFAPEDGEPLQEMEAEEL